MSDERLTAEYIYRKVVSGAVTIFEIGRCDNPRSFPLEWCDARVCEGFWGDETMAKTVVDCLNGLGRESQRAAEARKEVAVDASLLVSNTLRVLQAKSSANKEVCLLFGRVASMIREMQYEAEDPEEE